MQARYPGRASLWAPVLARVRAEAALREHRRRQAAERLLMGAGFVDSGLAFCRPDGGPLHPERYSRTFDREWRRP